MTQLEKLSRAVPRRAIFIGKFAFRKAQLHPELVKRFRHMCLVEHFLARNSVIIRFADGYSTCTGRENVRLLSRRPGSISPRQSSTIVNLCQRKGRQCPANILRWSCDFAWSYVSYLLTLPDADNASRASRYLSESDMLFNSQRRPLRGNYVWDDGETLPWNVLARRKEESCET